MNKSERKLEQDSTFISTMARVPLKSNFSINAILPEIAERDTPPEASPAPSATSDVDDVNSDDGDVNVDYESDTEGKISKFIWKKMCSNGYFFAALNRMFESFIL